MTRINSNIKVNHTLHHHSRCIMKTLRSPTWHLTLRAGSLGTGWRGIFVCTRSASNLIMWLTCIPLDSVPVNHMWIRVLRCSCVVGWMRALSPYPFHMFMIKRSPTFKIDNINLLFIHSTQQNDDADLVRYIKKNYGSYFCTSVAGYPEGMYGYFLSHFAKALWSRHYILKQKSWTLR